MRDDINRYLPLTEATYYIMLALIEPLHGYAVMQKVEQISQGTVKVGPGTLYGVFDTLLSAGMIVMVKEEDRRKSYTLSKKGRAVLSSQIKRLEIMSSNGQTVMDRL
jgi:DNA-binding PadR family transcriptional regulator